MPITHSKIFSSFYFSSFRSLLFFFIRSSPGPFLASSSAAIAKMLCSVSLCRKNGNEETCSNSKTLSNVDNNMILIPIPARLIFVQVYSFHMWTKFGHVIRHYQAPILLHFSDKYIRQTEEHIKLFFSVRFFAARETTVLYRTK